MKKNINKNIAVIVVALLAITGGAVIAAHASTTVGDNVSIGGTLGVTGASTLTGTLAANGGITVDTTNFTVDGTTGAVSTASTLAVTGASTLTGATTVTGALYANGGLDRSTAAALAIGATNATSVAITPNTTVTGTLGVTGATTLTGTLTANGAVTLGDAAADTLTVNAGLVYGAETITTGVDLGAATLTTGIDVGDLSTTGIDIGTATNRVVFSGVTGGTATDGSLIKAGTSGATMSSATADHKFIALYLENTSATGDNRGIYNRLYLTADAGTGGGESLRSYTDLTGGTVATAHGAHISLGMGESDTGGAVTGLGVGVRSTLGLPNVALAAGGTYAAMMPEIYSFGASSDAGAVTELSFIRVVNGGNATGRGTVDDDAFLFSLQGFTDGTGNLLYDPTLKIKAGSNTRYLVTSVTENKLDLGDSSAGIDIGTAPTGLTFTGGYTTTAIQLGTSASKLTLAAHDDHAIDINVTSASTDASNSVRPIHMIHTMTGVGGVGGRAEFELTTAVQLGGWANALKGYFNIGTGGGVTGLGSAVLAEMKLPATALTTGSYGVAEYELVTQSGGTTGGNPVAMQWFQVSGDSTATGDWEDNGYFMIIKGLTDAAGNIFDTDTNPSTDATLRILIGDTPYYILLSDSPTS